jgi:hypothetical protein
MSENSSDVLQTFSLKIKLQTIAYLIAWKLETKLQTKISEVLHKFFRQKKT